MPRALAPWSPRMINFDVAGSTEAIQHRIFCLSPCQGKPCTEKIAAGKCGLGLHIVHVDHWMACCGPLALRKASSGGPLAQGETSSGGMLSTGKSSSSWQLSTCVVTWYQKDTN
jgi:hypothetical protein